MQRIPLGRVQLPCACFSLSESSRLVVRCRISGTRDDESHDEGTRGTQSLWALLARPTSWSDRVWSTNIAGVWEVFCDADHAGDLGTRNPRSGLAMMWKSHLIMHGRAVQSTFALSCGVGVKAMLNDWHHEVQCDNRMRCDSSAG